jgi:hypothetical protein
VDRAQPVFLDALYLGIDIICHCHVIALNYHHYLSESHCAGVPYGNEKSNLEPHRCGVMPTSSQLAAGLRLPDGGSYMSMGDVLSRGMLMSRNAYRPLIHCLMCLTVGMGSLN